MLLIYNFFIKILYKIIIILTLYYIRKNNNSSKIDQIINQPPQFWMYSFCLSFSLTAPQAPHVKSKRWCFHHPDPLHLSYPIILCTSRIKISSNGYPGPTARYHWLFGWDASKTLVGPILINQNSQLWIPRPKKETQSGCYAQSASYDPYPFRRQGRLESNTIPTWRAYLISKQGTYPTLEYFLFLFFFGYKYKINKKKVWIFTWN